MIFCLILSSFILVFSPSVSFFEVQRNRKEFSLNPHESFSVISNNAFNINRIVIDLSKGTSFTICYQIITDYPTGTVNQSYQLTHLMINHSSYKFFTINSTSHAISGFVEIDYDI